MSLSMLFRNVFLVVTLLLLEKELKDEVTKHLSDKVTLRSHDWLLHQLAYIFNYKIFIDEKMLNTIPNTSKQ